MLSSQAPTGQERAAGGLIGRLSRASFPRFVLTAVVRISTTVDTALTVTDSPIPPLDVGDGRPRAALERRAGDRDGDAGQDAATVVGDLALDAGSIRRLRGGHV